MTPFVKQHTYRVEASHSCLPLVILPGFGNATRDYLAPFGDEEASLAAALRRRGFRASVVPVDRKDWFKVGRMLFSPAFYSSSCTTHPGYAWYLQRCADEVARVRQESGAAQVVLVGHSAGGWLARAFLGQRRYHGAGMRDADGDDDDDDDGAGGAPHPHVAALVTLGTPHTPPPPDKARDMTGGALSWVNGRWPGAHWAGQGVRYVAVAGRAVKGDREADRKTLPGYSCGSYKQVAGAGHDVVGDAVVPMRSALLAGAQGVVLDGVLHSMSRVRTFEEPSGAAWYGSDDVVDLWLQQACPDATTSWPSE